MPSVTYGQYSDRGQKALNQDHHGMVLPSGSLLRTKGIAVTISDGVSSSRMSHVASACAVRGFLSDYYATPESWSVKHAAQRVLAASNAWLHGQSRRGAERDCGHICTFSALILKSTSAHIFHVGDARIYRFSGTDLEQLTEDHRLFVGDGHSYLARALGVAAHVEVDYRCFPLTVGDVFMLATDGVYEQLPASLIRALLSEYADNLDAAAQALATTALQQGSQDNLTVQLLRIDALPDPHADEWLAQMVDLPALPVLEEGQCVDGWRVLRRLHSSSRSHVYWVEDEVTHAEWVLKAPTVELLQTAGNRQRFLREEWIARQINNPHVLPVAPLGCARQFLYSVSAYVAGVNGRQWMRAHPQPELSAVLAIVVQVARGLQALHRLDMLHQDLRPENILITPEGQAVIIDLGSTHVGSLNDDGAHSLSEVPQATLAYAAPEYFLGERGTLYSDQYSLAVLMYEMLSGELPYGTQVAATRSREQQNRLIYKPLFQEDRELPAWLDDVLQRALQPYPERRFEALSEFIFHLQNPEVCRVEQVHLNLTPTEKLRFWRQLAALQTVVLLFMLYLLWRR